MTCCSMNLCLSGSFKALLSFKATFAKILLFDFLWTFLDSISALLGLYWPRSLTVSTQGLAEFFFLTPFVVAFLDFRGVFLVKDNVGLADIALSFKVFRQAV